MSIEYVELTIEDAAPIEITISDIPEAGPGGGGSSLTIREADGTPSGVVTELVFPNTSVSIASGVGTLSVVPLFDTSITGGRNAFIVEPPPVAGQQANFLFESHSGPSGDDFGIARILANAEEGIQLVAKGNGGSDPSYNLSVLPTGYAVTQASNFRTAIDAAAASHTHGNISNAGAIGTTADLPISTTASGVINTRTVADFRALLGLATTDSPTFAGANIANIQLGVGSQRLIADANGVSVRNAGNTSDGTLRAFLLLGSNGLNFAVDVNGVHVGSDKTIGFSSTTNPQASKDVLFSRDAAGILAQRNGTNAQISRIYKTFTSATNFETYEIDAASDASNYRIGSRIGSTGGTTRGLQLGRYDAAGAWTSWLGISSSGNLSTDGSITIGSGNFLQCSAIRASGATLTVFNSSASDRADLVFRDITITPSSSRTLSTNGQFSIEMTSNTAGNLVYRGSDGTTRRMALTFS